MMLQMLNQIFFIKKNYAGMDETASIPGTDDGYRQHAVTA